jgi:hypothetical protein
MTRKERLDRSEVLLDRADRWAMRAAEASGREFDRIARQTDLYLRLGAAWAQLGDATYAESFDAPA